MANTVESACHLPILGPSARAWCNFMDAAAEHLPKPTRRTTQIRLTGDVQVHQQAVEHYGALAVTHAVYPDGRQRSGYKVTHTRTGVAMQVNDAIIRRRGTARRYLAGLAAVAGDLLCIDDPKDYGAQYPAALQRQIAALNHLAAPARLEYTYDPNFPGLPAAPPRPAGVLRRCDPDHPAHTQAALEGRKR